MQVLKKLVKKSFVIVGVNSNATKVTAISERVIKQIVRCALNATSLMEIRASILVGAAALPAFLAVFIPCLVVVSDISATSKAWRSLPVKRSAFSIFSLLVWSFLFFFPFLL